MGLAFGRFVIGVPSRRPHRTKKDDGGAHVVGLVQTCSRKLRWRRTALSTQWRATELNEGGRGAAGISSYSSEVRFRGTNNSTGRLPMQGMLPLGNQTISGRIPKLMGNASLEAKFSRNEIGNLGCRHEVASVRRPQLVVTHPD